MQDSKLNGLLAALPHAELERLQGMLEPADMPLGKVLHEPGTRLEHAYFPTTAVVSLVCMLEDGGSVEVAVVGHEGFIGVSLLLGSDTMPIRAMVQHAGEGYRIARKQFLEQVQHSGALRRLTLRYTQALIAQVMQTVACTRHHTVDQRLCCWLLLILDRSRSPELRMTQEMIASMLGVRREGITEAASKMQAAGLIRYGRGVIQVIDRPGLEARACECYQTVRQEYARVLPGMTEQG